MSISNQLFNPIYEEVRKLGLSYEIKESAGSTVIKISVENKNDFSRGREKFRFQTSRTVNGSSQVNWRKPQMSQEIFPTKVSFPDINFFRATPPPANKPSVMSLPLSSPPSAPPTTSTPLSEGSPPFPKVLVSESFPKASRPPLVPPPAILEASDLSETSINPYRINRRQIKPNPGIPNLLSPVAVSSTELTLLSNECSITEKKPPDVKHCTPEDMEAVKNLMKSIYERTKF